MSIQAGIWNFDGERPDGRLLERVGETTRQHGPDGKSLYVNGSLGMLYRPFHTTKESLLERQPHVSMRNNVVTWDGRLDNREELLQQLQEYLKGDHTDVAIVAAAYDKWGTGCLPKLLGDWAVVIWDHNDRVLILAKDFVGTRHLFYQRTHNRILWCTTLEPIVLLSEGPLQTNPEFIAGYLASHARADLTPYVGIDSVPPCSCVRVKPGKRWIHRYWNFDPEKKTRYRSDSEYEEHFRLSFRGAVRRRLRSHTPVVAELSGGMDSTSIVCMADLLIAEGKAETPRLDTMSYYDDEEPNWNERLYFQKVEEKRDRRGSHISAVPRDPFVALPETCFAAVPRMGQSVLLFEAEQHACMQAQGNRVLLSGIGGDEVLGGVPTPLPELADLLSQFHFVEFASKLKAWSLVRKQPWTRLLVKSIWTMVRELTRLNDSRNDLRSIPWLDKSFLQKTADSFRGSLIYRTNGCLPSQRVFLRAVSHLCDQLAYIPPPLIATREIRYPYLDRSLCEFLLSVPREQVLRPGHRRSLMRRALRDVVPSEILDRKRKGFVVRRIMTTFEDAWPTMQKRFSGSLSQKMHYVDDNQFLKAVSGTLHGELSNLTQLSRTVAIELWLRTLTDQNRIGPPTPSQKGIETHRSDNTGNASVA